MSTSNLTHATVTWEQLQQQLGLSIQPSKPAKQRGAPVTTSMPGATLEQLMQKSCKDGERTVHLTQLIGTLLASQFGLEEAIESCRRWNQKNQPPLEDDKVITTCESIHASDQRNHPERYPEHFKNVPLYDLQMGRIDRYLNTSPPLRLSLIHI